MNKTRTVFLPFLISLSCLASLSAGIVFGEPDLSDSDETIYTVRQNLPGLNPYSTLFYAKIKNGVAESVPLPVTCYPEQMEILAGGKILQVRNRYGIARYSSVSNSVSWYRAADTIPVDSIRLAPYSASPDGKWFCYVEKTGYASGRLILENTSLGKKVVLNNNAPFSYRDVPAKWAPDSSVVLYEKNGCIFFCAPESVSRGIEIEEKYRRVGEGTINSVNWAGSKYLLYIDCDMTYRINVKEMFTLGLYADIIGRGTPAGRLPEKFNPDRDRFSVNSDADSIVLVHEGKIISFYHLYDNSCNYVSVSYSSPYIDEKGSLYDSEVMWTTTGEPVIWMQIMPYSGEKPAAAVYRIGTKLLPILDVENSAKPFISPDGTKAAFVSGSTTYVYDTTSWKRISSLEDDNIVTAVWSGNDTIYAGGTRMVRKWNVADGKNTLLFLSSARSAYWDKTTGKIAAETGNGTTYIYDSTNGIWTENALVDKRPAVVQNGRYRVFCGNAPNLRYENALYVRTLSGKAVTKPVYPESIAKTPARKAVALVFDAYDNADGLPQILSMLDAYNITGTFCFNGEFIRRYPVETKQIAATVNDCASMFFTTADLTKVNADEDFIRRGLARNEDEFFQCTGRELSLLWHAPYYRSTKDIRDSGKKAGYSYISTMQKNRDTVTLEQSAIEGAEYLTPAQIIAELMESLKQYNGGVIPVTTGIARGERASYVYENLDLLISALLDEGYDITAASKLSE